MTDETPVFNLDDFEQLLKRAKQTWDSIPREEQDALIKAQQENWKDSGVSFPQPAFHWRPNSDPSTTSREE
jgi:hypothetical protein